MGTLMNLSPVFDSHFSYIKPVSSDIEKLRSEFNIEGLVLVQETPEFQATENALKFAEDSLHISAASVWVDLESKSFKSSITTIKEYAKTKGEFLPIGSHQDNHWLVRDESVKNLKLLPENGLSLDLSLEPRQIPSVQELAMLIPELKIMLTNIGSPYIARNEREPWGVYMMNLATAKNVYVKLNGILSLDTLPNWSSAHLKIFVEPVMRLFGYSRVVYGGDSALDPKIGDYGSVLSALLEAVSPLTDDQFARIFRLNGKSFYGA